jgi:hypothetical protein
MKRILISFLVICICFMFLTSFRKREKKIDSKPPLTKEEISGERLWIRITQDENYKKYPFWPGHEGIQQGQSPHGDLHRVHINPILYGALPISDKIAPDGSIIVKCNMNAEKEITAFTVMAKVKGYDPEENDWFWAKMSKDGKVQAEGKVKSCIECHKALKKNDYILLYQLNKKPN